MHASIWPHKADFQLFEPRVPAGAYTNLAQVHGLHENASD